MNIRYFVFICTIIAGVLTAGQANSRTVILEPAPVVAVSQTASYLYLNGQSDTALCDATLQKVALPAIIANAAGMLWKSVMAGVAWKGVKDMVTQGDSFISSVMNKARAFISDIDNKLGIT
ncbi:hypothetical protein [Bartonella sp. A05]|uniref:hypothetical protein n=1 Tax=Bartonella sp. A05 TaxID=2967261 RepID=UPI0022A99C8B|nr:hypothetical protein [Bartonella sp. A05]MCZ2203690.1 hypothetical protein [Bartonella sp. A05]